LPPTKLNPRADEQYGYQILLNGSRLGFYDPIRRTLNRAIGRDPNTVLASTALLAGALTGCIGAGLGSPLFLVKARIQAYSPALPVGAQHYYRNSWDALKTIVKSDGVRGLWRGVNAAFLRTAMVSVSSSHGLACCLGEMAGIGIGPVGKAGDWHGCGTKFRG
jgi:hypothetical protein